MSSKCSITNRGRVDYPFLILCDEHFFRWLKNSNYKSSTISKLMKIKATSLHFNGRHNIILRDQFNIIKTEFPEYLLRAAVFSEDPSPVKDDDDDEYSTYIKHASNISSKNSIPIMILTANPQKDSYILNSHFKDLGGEVSIYSEEDAVKIVNRLFREFEKMIELKRTKI
ncbi:MAG: hypothetical protein V1914_01670 [archaeon]